RRGRPVLARGRRLRARQGRPVRRPPERGAAAVVLHRPAVPADRPGVTDGQADAAPGPGVLSEPRLSAADAPGSGAERRSRGPARVRRADEGVENETTAHLPMRGGFVAAIRAG